ncbi:C6 finger domain-containing protein [Apiospora arundinis]
MTVTLPSILVFGPQGDLASEKTRQDLRLELNSSTRLSALREAVDDLPQFWEALVNFDPSLGRVPGAKYIGELKQWLNNTAAPVPYPQTSVPNHCALALSVLVQITQYTHYLDHLGHNSHPRVLSSTRLGGVHGFCVGILSAIAVAVSTTEADLGHFAAIALRLAVCIGAYVDLDGIYSSIPTGYRAIALRWREGRVEDKAEVTDILESTADAYISSINDDASVTVTVTAIEEDGLIDKARKSDLRTKTLHICGRYHTPDHAGAVEKILKFASITKDLQFPDAKELNVPLRNTATGDVVSGCSLTRLALESTLTNVADWYKTLQSAIQQLPGSHHTIAFAGLGNAVPASLVGSGKLTVLALGDSHEPNTKQGEKLSSNHVNGLANGVNGINGVNSNDTGIDFDVYNDLDQYPPHSIAIVGMAGRFPGADSVDDLWDLMTAGKSMVEPAPLDRLKLPQTGEHASTKWWGNFLQDPAAFDHKFFKKSPREALAWDPQQRILLEVVYEALESAGYFGPRTTPETLDYGCYIGAVMSNWYDNLSCHPATAYATGGTQRSFLSGCMSHYFGWTGPALSIDTACSSSLVALNAACRAIWSGECSRAVAGGTNVFTSPFDYRNLAAAGFLSPSGQCKPFDAAADGYCRGEAVSVVVLKRLSDAIKENDNILGVVVGSAANQNHNHSHISAPQSDSQLDLYRRVIKLGGVEPEAVTYVEAHGTGTGVGDPVEVRSIRDAFGGTQRESLLHFGSIKGNIGHVEATAGVAGLVKVLLMMRHRTITPQASFLTLNPKLPDFRQHQMSISREVIPWTAPSLLALVNSYGAAGSNSAAMIRQKPSYTRTSAPVKLSKYPLFISAGSSESLSRFSKKLLAWVRDAKSAGRSDLLAQLSFNLADRANHSLSHYLATAVSTIGDLESSLESATKGSGISQLPKKKPVVLVFGGQEGNYIGLSEEVYRVSKVFRTHLNSVNDLMISHGMQSLYPSIFETAPIKDLVTLHSALFAVQSTPSWATASASSRPSASRGVLSLPDAWKLVSGRAALMQKHWGPEPGSMIFVQANRATVEEMLRDLAAERGAGHYAEIACHNGPESHVVVGSSDSIDALQNHVETTSGRYSRSSVRTKRLNVTNGFHSRFTEPMLGHLDALAKKLEWRKPQIHLETTDEIQSNPTPDYRSVSKHTRGAVFFQQAIERLNAKLLQCTWIEAGPSSSVIKLVKGCVVGANSHAHAFHASPLASKISAQDLLTDMTVDLWRSGCNVQYWPFHRSQKLDYEHISLPPIQFEKTRHWLDFTGNRGAAEVAEADGNMASMEETHELITFTQFNDASESEAVFRIDPQSDRFQEMLGGHVMAGQSLAPASLYFEVVARAALLLAGDTQVRVYVPVVDDLAMKSPIGHIITKKISLVLKKLGGVATSWSFSIMTQDAEGHSSPQFEHATGTVCLKKRDNVQSAREFERFGMLIGQRRCEEILGHPDAETMRGRHIYRAFNTVVYYGEAFHGIKEIACVNMESAGIVRITPDPGDPADQRLCDTPMTDSFMQFAGLMVNYFHNPSMEEVFVCMKIEHIQMGGGFDPDAGEWLVYSTMSRPNENDVVSDVYVFDAGTKQMVMSVFGLRFAKMSQSLLGRMLKSVNKIASAAAPSTTIVGERPIDCALPPIAEQPPAAIFKSRSAGKRQEIIQVVSNVSDVPVEQITDEMSLDDLGVDSLMATEMLNDIRSVLGVTIDLSSFLFFPNIQAVVKHIEEKLGVSAEADSILPETNSGIGGDIDTPSDKPGANTPDESIEEPKPLRGEIPTISAPEAFQRTRLDFDRLAETTQAAGFWDKAYPCQARLVLAYVVEAFAELGCVLKNLRSGNVAPQVQVLDKHKRLVRQLWRVLEDGGLVVISSSSEEEGQNQTFTRTEMPVDPTDAESIYHNIIDLYPQHAMANRLTRATGSQMAACLRGDKEGIQIIFGDRDNKKTVQELYEFWPLFGAPTFILGNFLTEAFSNATRTGGGKFRILEIGGGTGGTTRYIVNLLKSQGIEFEYVFTDVSSSLVRSTARQFEGIPEVSSDILDVEKPPKHEYVGAFHCVIATNCIHATRNLETSLGNIRPMLREDGVLALIEITRNMFWMDTVFGLLEGWWLFDDGREHALIDERQWERKLKAAGFGAVSWSDGDTPESKTVRVIAAFPNSDAAPERTVKAAMETVTYKMVGDLEIEADVYYPLEGEVLTGSKMPIALMIHGGSHILFSRKDIRPAQTRLLLRKGFLPVSLDYRLCPEVSLTEGPMVDVCDALDWARKQLPELTFPNNPGLQIDGENVVVVGWSSGGQLAMSLAWTAPARGLRPPEAILAFYAPTNYEDEWWQNPIEPNGAPYKGQRYDVLDGVEDQPIANYEMVGAWEEPVADPRSHSDPRTKIVLHINWKAQTLPVILGGLPSRRKVVKSGSDGAEMDWNALPQPSLDTIRAASPYAHIKQGTYRVPAFFIHGTADDLIPWQQSQETYQLMREAGIETGLVLVDGAPHICDLSSDPISEGWKAVVRGYDFICSFVS